MCCSKKFPWIVMLCCFSLTLYSTFAGKPTAVHADDTKSSAASAAKSEGKKVTDKLLRHVVLFQFKQTSSKDDVEKIVDAFRELPSKISEIADFEWGTNNSPEGLTEGLTHGFIISFKSEKDRDTYLTHAAHKAFVEVLKPHLERPVVLDFWASK